jgi:hypothetical protein
MIYLVTVHFHTPAAKTKGIANAGNNKGGTVYGIHAENDDEAWRKLCAACEPRDTRPLAGRSYLRRLRLGQTVSVHRSYPKGYPGHLDHNPTTGKVSEIPSDFMISVEFEGYHTRFVDFSVHELVDHEIP